MQFNQYIIFTLTSELQVTFIILAKRFIVESIGTATTFRCSSLKMTEEIYHFMKVIYLTFLEKLTKATDMIKIKREKKPSVKPW